MLEYMKKYIFLLIPLFLFYGCLSVDLYAKRQLKFVSSGEIIYPPQKSCHKIDLFFNGDVPEKEYEVIGEISGIVTDDIKPVLTAKARQSGGDGVIDIKISRELETLPSELKVEPGILQGEQLPVYTPGYSIEKFNINAKVIRYK